MPQRTLVLLDNIRSAYNVGAIFRTCDGAGVEALYLVGYTPTPRDRFGRQQPEIHKTSLGASDIVPWQQCTNEAAVELIRTQQVNGYTVVAVEQTATALSLPDWQPPESVLYIFGNEIDGVAAPLLKAADVHIQIPMHGQKESLNVSVAAGIVLYHS